MKLFVEKDDMQHKGWYTTKRMIHNKKDDLQQKGWYTTQRMIYNKIELGQASTKHSAEWKLLRRIRR